MRRPRLSVAGFYLAVSDDFHAGQVLDRRAMIFPADEAFDLVAILHPRAFIQPVIGLGAGPIATADSGGASTHEQRSVRSGRKRGGPTFSLAQHPAEFLAQELACAVHDPVRLPRGGGQQRHNTPDRIAAQEGKVNACVTGRADIIVHLPSPILVVAHRDKTFAAL